MRIRTLQVQSSGLTFFEIFASIIFLMVCLSYLYSFWTSSNRATIDSYNETIAFTLAQETMDFVGNLGYEALQNKLIIDNIKQYFGLGEFRPARNIQLVDGVEIVYPPDYQLFERRIDIKNDIGPHLTKITVTVQPIQGGFRNFFNKELIIIEKIVGAEYD